MNALLLVHIPTILVIAWATWRTNIRGSKNDAAALAACGTIIVTNAVIRHFTFEGYTLPCSIIIVQQILASLIIPLAYLFIAMQTNSKLASGTTTLLFALIAFLLFPNISIITNGHSTIDAGALDGCKSFYIVGEKIYEYTIADMIVTLQAIVTTARIAPLFMKLRDYGLQPSRDVKIFTAWWALTVFFVVFSSFNSDTTDIDPTINVVCHVGLMVLLVGIFFLMGRGINIQPELMNSKNSDTQDSFAAKSKELREQLMSMMTERHIHLLQNYGPDDAIEDLKTNRSYFYRMVREEFGCTFSELMNRERVKVIKELLATTDDKVSDIGARCGFKNTSYMIRVFKDYEVYSPAEWRKRHRKMKE